MAKRSQTTGSSYSEFQSVTLTVAEIETLKDAKVLDTRAYNYLMALASAGTYG